MLSKGLLAKRDLRSVYLVALTCWCNYGSTITFIDSRLRLEEGELWADKTSHVCRSWPAIDQCASRDQVRRASLSRRWRSGCELMG